MIDTRTAKIAACLAAAAACHGPIAAAQPAAGPVSPRAEDPRAPVPPLAYESPFARYRPLADNAVSPWKAANDEVGRIGGWKVYAREAHEGAASATSPAPAVPAPARPTDVPVRPR